MEPIRMDGPSIDYGVARRLRRLDRQLRLTWSRYALDPFTGIPILAKPGIDPDTGVRYKGEVLDPAHYLWRKQECSSHHFFIRTFEAPFSHYDVRGLETDLARFHRPEDLGRVLRERYDTDLARKQRAYSGQMQDKVVDSKRLLHDTVTGDRTVNFYREAKGFSYAGQTKRTSGAEHGRVPVDNRILGLDD